MKIKISITLIVPFLMSLTPSISRTWKWASDAYGLIVLATLDPDQMTFNPYSKNGFFINPEIAIFLLENSYYPYNRCTEISENLVNCDGSLIIWVGRFLNVGDSLQMERGYRLLTHFISRGEDINHLVEGMAPIHEAILYHNSKYLKVLLEADASLATRINRPGTEFDGLDPLQYLDLLESKGNQDFGDMRSIIERSKI